METKRAVIFRQLVVHKLADEKLRFPDSVIKSKKVLFWWKKDKLNFRIIFF